MPVGTVKSWLHRGRNAMAAQLGDDVRRQASPAPAEVIRAQGHRRERTRRATVAALAVVALLTAVFAGIRLFPPHRTVPITPPSPSPSPADPMRKVDWWSATITFPPQEGTRGWNCPSGATRFARDSAEPGRVTGTAGGGTAIFDPRGVQYGDITG